MSRFAALAPLLHLVATAPVPTSQDCFERFAAIERPSQRVLFVGNSFTFGNDLPCVVAELALSLDPPLRLEVGMVARDGMTLETHWLGGQVARRPREKPWDVVVLQEQSSRPITDPALMETHVRRFAAAARRVDARVVLFQTWARVNEPETEKPRAATYRRIADAVGAKVAPVGAAWSLARAEHPGIRLHAADGLHASLAGSYLAASVLLGVLAGRSPVGATATSSGDPGSAELLQTLAWRAITELTPRPAF
jgi:hypothetical protein